MANRNGTRRLVASPIGGDALPAHTVRLIQKGEKVDALLDEVVRLTFQSGGLEHAIVSFKDGSRAIVRGGPGGIIFDDRIKRIILHTHPTPTGPSAADFEMLRRLGQRSSFLYELFGGGLTKFFLKD